MNRITLNPTSWPIWLKIGFATSLLLTLIYFPAFVVQRSRVDEIALSNARIYIGENGAAQLAALTNAIDNARASLDTFMSNPTYENQLQSALLGRITSNLDLNFSTVDSTTLESLFQNTLLNRVATLYENVRLIDRDGQVIARAQLGGRAGAGATDEANTPAYRAIQSAVLQQQSSALTITVDDFPVIDYAVALRWRDGSLLGYVVARFSNARALFANLRFADDSYPAYAALVTPQGDIIAPVETLQNYSISFNEELVNRAATGASGVERLVTDTGADVIGFYSRVSNTPLVLIAQTSTQLAFDITQSELIGPALAIFVGGFFLMLIIVLLVTQLITPPIQRMRRAALRVAEGEYSTPFPDAQRGDELGSLAASLETLRDTVKSRVGDLELRVASRGRDIAATQEISRYAANQRDLQLLMDRVVDLIIQRFPVIYHAQIFLIDEEGRYAVVRASTGEVGQTLMMRGHRLAVGSISVIGQVTDQARTIIARDTSASQVHRRNEFLPDTRAELAVPLLIGERVIGALDVQSKERDAFTDDLVVVLQTMADQIAIAIENARLYEESLRRVADIEAANRRSTLAAWQDYMRVLRASGVSRDAGIADTRTQEPVSALRQQAIASGSPAVGEPTPRATVPIAIPILLRGEKLGAVEWELPLQGFSEDKIELARELANRLAVSMDNARLFQESQRNAERERLVSTIASRLTAQTSIDTILQTAVREVGQALRVPNVSIRLRSIGGMTADDAASPANVSGTAASVNGTHSPNGVNGGHDRPAAEAPDAQRVVPAADSSTV